MKRITICVLALLLLCTSALAEEQQRICRTGGWCSVVHRPIPAITTKPMPGC